jgi:uncharacterized membrane protein
VAAPHLGHALESAVPHWTQKLAWSALTVPQRGQERLTDGQSISNQSVRGCGDDPVGAEEARRMAIRWKYTSKTGETRPWTLKEIVAGKPIGRATHVMFVHFPIAFYIAVLAFDVLSHIGNHPWAVPAATWLLIGAFAATLVLVVTGLVDRSTMRPGVVRTTATRHMLFQFAAAAVFVIDFAIRWGDHHRPTAEPLWIVLDVIGVALVMIGADIGGKLVYGFGMRVQES